MITAPYGTWNSPVTAELIASGTTQITGFLVDKDGSSYWTEARPSNKGRHTLVKKDVKGEQTDITPPDFSVRTFVHEYGGGSFTVHDGIVYASNANDSAVYEFVPGTAPRRITLENKIATLDGKPTWDGIRLADMRWSPYGLVAIAEKHTPGAAVENFLALVDMKTGQIKPLASGSDFYASPALSLNYDKIAWISWSHPHMPWDQSELWIADIDSSGLLANKQKIAGLPNESVMQPEWSADGTLYFISDRDKGWWNLHSYSKNGIKNLTPMPAEIGEPLWIFDKSAYTILGNEIYFTFNKDGKWNLAYLNTSSNTIKQIPRDGVNLQFLRSSKSSIQFVESYSDKSEAIVEIAAAPSFPAKTLYEKTAIIDKNFISAPLHIEFPSEGRTAYGYYYAPKNPEYKGPEGTKPPLLVAIHGGPTAQAKGFFQPRHQFWTSRGFAVLDVNYGGSTGYGKAYRNLLNKNWGVVDVEDCINGARYVVEKGFVDPKKIVIRGGSSGGYTTLAVMASSNLFVAGADYFGVADVTALAQDTHKFESRYMEILIGKYPEERELWVERSPIHSIHKIKNPLIIFQGENDPIVPKNQSIMVFEALKKAGIRSEMHIYPDEEHGFKYPANTIHSLKREAEFYLEVFDSSSI